MIIEINKVRKKGRHQTMIYCFSFFSVFFVACVSSDKEELDPLNRDWPTYGGNSKGTRYSDLTQINLENVKNLEVAWIYETGDNKPGERGRNIQTQPIVVDKVLYGVAPSMKLFAADAATGEEIWRFDPFLDPDVKPVFHPIRGVAYWEDGDDKRILYGVGPKLYAIDALTGKKVESFGVQGAASLHEGLGDMETVGRDVTELSVTLTSPGMVYKNLLIIGSAVSEGGNSAPGYIRAFNIRTGKLAWVFKTIPRAGEYGYDTWSKDSYKKLGGTNNWAGLVIDEKRGIVYAGTGAPSSDFYGGDRIGQNLFANSVLALNASTGERVWHFQTVHHDLWDYDLPTPPNLMTVTHNGKKIDAVAQATKDGYVFLFDRVTGEPLFPVEEVPVKSTYALPGEQPWPTQPRPTKPEPFAIQELNEDNLTNRTPEARAYVLERYINSRREGRYTNPSLEGSLIFGMGGGAEWGGNASDPNGILYQNSNNMLWWLQMRENPNYGDQSNIQSKGTLLFNTNCASCHSIDSRALDNGAQAIPNLANIASRMSQEKVSSIIETGSGRMPSFQHLSKVDKEEIIDFLFRSGTKSPSADEFHNPSTVIAKSDNDSDFPYVPPYLNNGNTQFRDQDGYPALKPPWGTMNAIDMNTGDILWQVPLGEYPELVKQGLSNTGTENHGGPVVTAGGLVFIAATYDEKIRAFNSKTGAVVWEYTLPAGGFATPITYMVDGKQYIAIAAGGTRYGLKPGGSYVAFALPD